MVTLGIYSVAADISVCPGVDSASKNEYQNILGGKDGRCVRVTTLPPSCAECLVIWSLNRPEPSGPHRPVIGIALPLPLPTQMTPRDHLSTPRAQQHNPPRMETSYKPFNAQRAVQDNKPAPTCIKLHTTHLEHIKNCK